jgi:hypothetical protein
MVATDEVWEIYWHPDAVTHGRMLMAPTLEELIELINEENRK